MKKLAPFLSVVLQTSFTLAPGGLICITPPRFCVAVRKRAYSQAKGLAGSAGGENKPLSLGAQTIFSFWFFI
jgi:hypothetical protein